jgi:hypothetical protein
MRYVAVTHGDVVINAVPTRIRWNARLEKVIKKHIDLYHGFKHATQNDAIDAILEELNKIKHFKGTRAAVRARFHMLNKQDNILVNQGEDRVVSCKVILKYASGKKTIIDNLNPKFAKQF